MNPQMTQLFISPQITYKELREIGMHLQILGSPLSLTSSQPQIGPSPGSTPMINNPMKHGTPGAMDVRVLYLISKYGLMIGS